MPVVRFDAPFTFKCGICAQVVPYRTKMKAHRDSDQYRVNCPKCSSKIVFTFDQNQNATVITSGAERFGVQIEIQEENGTNGKNANENESKTNLFEDESAEFNPPKISFANYFKK
ncbi:Saf4/Yju2_protein [Hexamita inflata]|uniref:Saf4/Yju2 protein n=1 Tax=Hexamita inflata TaxID=28002 RepID=A0AA86U844_9EUKA|nr:Saf4/Yju2 protein [Hexamita inflata]